jgi:hypothetical protein
VASDLNYAPDDVIANLSAVVVGGDGRMQVGTNVAAVNVVIHLDGWFTP